MSRLPPPDGALDARRQLIALENTLTGRAFLQRMQQERRAGTALWQAMRDSAIGRELSVARKIEPFRAFAVAEGATLYRGTGGGRRGLLVAFTGRQSRMMLPVAGFLQHLRAREWDVLLLADRTSQHYRFGCGTFASTFPDLVSAVLRLAGGHARIVAIGSSMGGLPAVRFGLQTGHPAVACGARPAGDVARLFAQGGAPPAFDPVCACLPQQSRDLILVHAAGHAEDAAAAERLAAQAGGVNLGVEGCSTHAVLADLWKQDRLGPFLAALLANAPRDERVIAARRALSAPPAAARTAGPARLLLRRMGLA